MSEFTIQPLLETANSLPWAEWCEASGMVPQLQRIADPFGIGVYSSGGFDSVTAKHQIARLWTGAPVTVQITGVLSSMQRSNALVSLARRTSSTIAIRRTGTWGSKT